MDINLTNVVEIIDMRHNVFEVDLFFETLKKYNKVCLYLSQYENCTFDVISITCCKTHWGPSDKFCVK